MSAPKDGTRVQFEWTRPRTSDRLLILAEYHSDVDGWEVVQSSVADDPTIPVVLTSSEKAELDYVAGDEHRAGLEAEAIDLAESARESQE